MTTSFVALDLETTGLSPEKDHIIEVGAVRFQNGKKVGELSILINPGSLLPEFITELTGIDDQMLVNERSFDQVADEILTFLGDSPLVGHNILFDYSFLKTHFKRQNISFETKAIDTFVIAKKVLKEQKSKRLSSLTEYYGIDLTNAHRALADATATAELYFLMAKEFDKTHPELFVAKPIFYRIKKDEPMTARQKRYLIDLMKYHKIATIPEIDQFTKSKASKTIDQILSEYGSMR